MRLLFRLFSAAVLLARAFAQTPAPDAFPPIVFAHGNGDDAAKWMGVIWLFESNGYPANRLFAVRFTDPSARTDDERAEPYRSSTVDQAAELAAAVTRALIQTGAKKAVLIGSSRGGLTIRNYLRNGGGAASVSHAILCGTPNHGVSVGGAPGNEFNGRGTFLTRLNAGGEVVPGVRFLTLRSDKLDKYAQPAGVGYEGPALEGAENVVLAGLDHRELAFDPRAFPEMYRFITGHAPERLTVIGEAEPVVFGIVSGYAGMAPTNRPAAGVRLRVFPLKPGSAEREAAPVLDLVTDETGRWGPLRLKNGVEYEWQLERDGRSISYFKAPIERSTTILNLRFLPPAMPGSGNALRLTLARPQGYFSKGRDPVTMDGAEVAEIPEGIPTRDSVAIGVAESKRAGVLIVLRGEKIWARPVKSEGPDASIVDFLYE
jgi:triacylglycerol lipase